MSTVKVYFALDTTLATLEIEPPALVIAPTSDDWNDFSLRTRFRYELFPGPEKRRAAGEVYLAFQGSDETPVEKTRAALQPPARIVVPAELLPAFYTMHPDMQAYREVVRQHGVAGAEELLLQMNDLVAIKRRGNVPTWFNDAIVSRPFTMSFLRNAEAFFAFHNAGSILGGLERESTGISNKLRLEFKLPAFQNSHLLELSFDTEGQLPKRIAIVIGKNGVGKSQTLAHFVKALLSRGRGLTTDDGEPPMINRLLAVSSPGETRNTFPGPPRQARIAYQRIFLTRNPYGDRQSGLGDALVRLARSPEIIRGKSRWELFCQSVSVIASLHEIAVRFRQTSKKADRAETRLEEVFPLAEMINGGEQERLERWGRVDGRADVFHLANGKLFPFSSGQLTFVRFAAQACLHIENGTMVLVDEPETHLHPNYISLFVRLLDRLLAETGSFAILATHSAYLVREVPRSQVIVLRRTEDERVEVVPVRLRTLGADIGEISHFVFEDQLFGHLLQDVRNRLKSEPAAAAKNLKSLESELSVEAWMNLSREVPNEAQQ